MSSTAQRLAKTGGVFLVLALAGLTGCAVTTGGAAAGPPAAGYAVCSGGHASRFPGREEIGRACRPAASLQAIY